MSNDITIVSTTDSDEQVQAALGAAPPPADAPPPVDPKKVETPPAEPPTAPAKADNTPAEPEPEPPTETPEQQAEREQQDTARTNRRDRRKKSIQGEIDELTAKKHTLRRDVEADEARLVQLREQRQTLEGGSPAETPTPEPAPKAADAPPEFSTPQPKLDDVDKDGKALYSDYDGWILALTKWSTAEAKFVAEQIATTKISERERAERERIDRASADRAQTEALDTYQQKLAEFRKRTPDFDAVYAEAKEDVQEIQQRLGPASLDVIDLYTTRDADHGPAIVHYLVTHPDEMERIAALPAPLQLAQLGRLDERLGNVTHGSLPTVPPVTRAPEPMRPLGSSPTPAVTPDPDNETYREYTARRNREELAAAGR